MKIIISVSGSYQKVFSNVQKALADTSPFIRDTEKYYDGEVKKQFNNEGGIMNESRWRSLSPYTIAKRLKAGFGASPILVNTGRLKASIRKVQSNKKQLSFGSTVSYYRFHQLGTDKTPRRQILGLTNKLIKDVSEIFKNYILKSLG